jgi:hypothetical protein
MSAFEKSYIAEHHGPGFPDNPATTRSGLRGTLSRQTIPEFTISNSSGLPHKKKAKLKQYAANDIVDRFSMASIKGFALVCSKWLMIPAEGI